jgi:hypothetical protein
MMNESKNNSGGGKVVGRFSTVARRQGAVVELGTSQMQSYPMLQSMIELIMFMLY